MGYVSDARLEGFKSCYLRREAGLFVHCFTVHL
jgi:hypothetical protein